MLISGLAVGAVLGFVLQRGRFCVTGALRDVWIGGQTRWLTAFLVVIAVHAVGLAALTTLGIISPDPGAMPIVATVLGAFLFGYAIVLAGGCATGTYYRAGEGLVGSWIALALYCVSAAVMKYGPAAGLTDTLRSATLTPDATVQETLGVSPWLPTLVFAAAVALAVCHHLNRERSLPTIATLPPRRAGLAHVLLEKTWHPFATALAIGLIATLAWPLSAATGRNAGLGITTPSANWAAWLTNGDAELLDWGAFLVLGILIGAHIAARASGEFRVRVPDATTILRSATGGVLMGVGAALAGGCTIGNAMVNTAQFSYQGWVSFAVMLLGTGVATKRYVLGSAKLTGATPAPQQTSTAGV